MAANSTGKGWQSGIISLVFFMASKPAALENSNTSPFGTCLFCTASIVLCDETFTTAVAIALRKLFCLCVILTINYSLSIDELYLQKLLFPKPAIHFLLAQLFRYMHLLQRGGALMK